MAFNSDPTTDYQMAMAERCEWSSLDCRIARGHRPAARRGGPLPGRLRWPTPPPVRRRAAAFDQRFDLRVEVPVEDMAGDAPRPLQADLSRVTALRRRGTHPAAADGATQPGAAAASNRRPRSPPPRRWRLGLRTCISTISPLRTKAGIRFLILAKKRAHVLGKKVAARPAKKGQLEDVAEPAGPPRNQ